MHECRGIVDSGAVTAAETHVDQQDLQLGTASSSMVTTTLCTGCGPELVGSGFMCNKCGKKGPYWCAECEGDACDDCIYVGGGDQGLVVAE